MADPLSMSLEDLMKKNSSGSGGGRRGGGGRGRGRGSRGGRSSGSSSGSMDIEGARGSGPIRRGRKQVRSSPYKPEAGGDSDSKWSHDLFDVHHDDEDELELEEVEVVPSRQRRGAGGRGARSAASTSTTSSSSAGSRAGGKPRGITLGHSVALTNVPYSMKQADLEDLFSQVGELRSAEILLDEATGRPIGCAKVVFCRLADATSAVEQFDQQLIEGRRVSVVLGDFEEVESSEPVASTSAPRRERRGRGGASASSGGHWRGGSSGSRASSSSSSSDARPEWLQHDIR